MLADRTLPTNRVLGFGIGHASDRVRASLGLAGSGGQDGTVIMDADFAVGNGLWLGAGGQFADNRDTWSLVGRVGFFWGRDGAGSAAPRQPGDDTPRIEPPPPPPPFRAAAGRRARSAAPLRGD